MKKKTCEYFSEESENPLNWKYGLDHALPDYKHCPMCGRKVYTDLFDDHDDMEAGDL